jgi:hypothetical protein
MAAATTRRTKTTRSPPGGRNLPPFAHPHSVPVLAEEESESMPDQPFAEGAQDSVDPDLRHRMISEAAYRRYTERGYADGYDLDDWLQAEADVDHLLVNREV